MIKVVCAVWDSAMEAYANPFFAPSRGWAVRSFSDEVNRVADDNMLNKHPEDYELRVLAEFNEGSGVFQVPAEGVGAQLLRGKAALKDE